VVLGRLITFGIVCLWSVAANAQAIDVSLTNDDGKPVGGAVVMFTPSVAGDQQAESGGSFAINQKNVAFDPFITLVPVNSTVTFKNEDSVLHHVFSFSEAKRFDLELFGAAEPQDVVFDAPGIVSVGCNIHDGMIAYVFVSEAPYATQTNDDGQTVLENLPEGAGVLTIWHPLMRGRGNMIQQDVTVAPDMPPVVASAEFRRGATSSGRY